MGSDQPSRGQRANPVIWRWGSPRYILPGTVINLQVRILQPPVARMGVGEDHRIIAGMPADEPFQREAADMFHGFGTYMIRFAVPGADHDHTPLHPVPAQLPVAVLVSFLAAHIGFIYF